jgi:hypothetical protein
MREYRLQIPSGRAWVLSCESSIVQECYLEGKGERALYGNGVLFILFGALPSLFGFQHIRWKLPGDVVRRAVNGAPSLDIKDTS